MSEIADQFVRFSGTTLTGPSIDRLSRQLGDLGDIFADKTAWATMPKEQLIFL